MTEPLLPANVPGRQTRRELTYVQIQSTATCIQQILKQSHEELAAPGHPDYAIADSQQSGHEIQFWQPGEAARRRERRDDLLLIRRKRCENDSLRDATEYLRGRDLQRGSITPLAQYFVVHNVKRLPAKFSHD